MPNEAPQVLSAGLMKKRQRRVRGARSKFRQGTHQSSPRLYTVTTLFTLQTNPYWECSKYNVSTFLRTIMLNGDLLRIQTVTTAPLVFIGLTVCYATPRGSV